jgi:hypothetical protein
MSPILIIILSVCLTVLAVGITLLNTVGTYGYTGWSPDLSGCLLVAIALFILFLIGAMYLGRWLL